VLQAFERFLVAPRGVFARMEASEAAGARERLRGITRVITSSPALIAREQQVFVRYTESLAALLAQETGAGPDDVEPRVVANALIGTHRALIDFVRRRTLTGHDEPRRLARELRAQARTAFGRLEEGLGGYARAAETPEDPPGSE
jgi:hypothetical protein